MVRLSRITAVGADPALGDPQELFSGRGQRLEATPSPPLRLLVHDFPLAQSWGNSPQRTGPHQYRNALSTSLRLCAAAARPPSSTLGTHTQRHSSSLHVRPISARFSSILISPSPFPPQGQAFLSKVPDSL